MQRFYESGTGQGHCSRSFSNSQTTKTELISEREALGALRKNKDIIVLQADKGNATVVLDTVDYEKKAMAILDHPPFRQLQKDPTSQI